MSSSTQALAWSHERWRRARTGSVVRAASQSEVTAMIAATVGATLRCV